MKRRLWVKLRNRLIKTTRRQLKKAGVDVKNPLVLALIDMSAQRLINDLPADAATPAVGKLLTKKELRKQRELQKLQTAPLGPQLNA